MELSVFHLGVGVGVVIYEGNRYSWCVEHPEDKQKQVEPGEHPSALTLVQSQRDLLLRVDVQRVPERRVIARGGFVMVDVSAFRQLLFLLFVANVLNKFVLMVLVVFEKENLLRVGVFWKGVIRFPTHLRYSIYILFGIIFYVIKFSLTFLLKKLFIFFHKILKKTII